MSIAYPSPTQYYAWKGDDVFGHTFYTTSSTPKQGDDIYVYNDSKFVKITTKVIKLLQNNSLKIGKNYTWYSYGTGSWKIYVLFKKYNTITINDVEYPTLWYATLDIFTTITNLSGTTISDYKIETGDSTIYKYNGYKIGLDGDFCYYLNDDSEVLPNPQIGGQVGVGYYSLGELYQYNDNTVKFSEWPSGQEEQTFTKNDETFDYSYELNCTRLPSSDVIYLPIKNLYYGGTKIKEAYYDNNLIFSKLVKQISCSCTTTWVLSHDGELYGCGNGSVGQQGNDARTNVLIFTKRATNVKKVFSSMQATAYITNDDKLFMCGVGTNYTFIQMATNVKDVDISNYCFWYIDKNDNLYGCGDNTYGQQGSGDTTKVLSFVQRATNVKKVIAQNTSTMYITNDDKLFMCGMNTHGEQGSGDTTNVSTFTQRATNVKDVYCGGPDTLYIDKNDNLYGCGDNSYKQLGLTSQTITTFTQLATNVKMVSPALYHTAYVTNDNNLFIVGRGDDGQQGSGSTGGSSTFVQRASNVKYCWCLYGVSWYVDINNNLYGCGSNGKGQQGSGDTTKVLSFVQRATNIKALVTYKSQNDAVTTNTTTWYIGSDGEIYGCGRNESGQHNTNDTSNVLVFTKRRFS